MSKYFVLLSLDYVVQITILHFLFHLAVISSVHCNFLSFFLFQILSFSSTNMQGIWDIVPCSHCSLSVEIIASPSSCVGLRTSFFPFPGMLLNYNVCGLWGWKKYLLLTPVHKLLCLFLDFRLIILTWHAVPYKCYQMKTASSWLWESIMCFQYLLLPVEFGCTALIAFWVWYNAIFFYFLFF